MYHLKIGIIILVLCFLAACGRVGEETPVTSPEEQEEIQQQEGVPTEREEGMTTETPSEVQPEETQPAEEMS